MPKFRKKPVVIEAITFEDLVHYAQGHDLGESFNYKGAQIEVKNQTTFVIPTLEGEMEFTPEDMLITGVDGEIYPCKISIFNKTYDPV